jgi:hypothetical protein
MHTNELELLNEKTHSVLQIKNVVSVNKTNAYVNLFKSMLPTQTAYKPRRTVEDTA